MSDERADLTKINICTKAELNTSFLKLLSCENFHNVVVNVFDRSVHQLLCYWYPHMHCPSWQVHWDPVLDIWLHVHVIEEWWHNLTDSLSEFKHSWYLNVENWYKCLHVFLAVFCLCIIITVEAIIQSCCSGAIHIQLNFHSFRQALALFWSFRNLVKQSDGISVR